MKKLLNINAFFLYSALFLIFHENNSSFKSSPFCQRPRQALSGWTKTIKTHPKKSAAALAGTGLSTYTALQWYRDYQEDQEWNRKISEKTCRDMSNIFPLGERNFCTLQPPTGMTREAWYKQKLQEQEAYLRSQIINLLKISPQELTFYMQQAEKELKNEEDQIYASQPDIRGTWVKDLEKRELRRATHDHKDTPTQQSFTVTDKDIARVKQLLKDFGFQGKLATIDPDDCGGMIAMQSLVQIQPDIFDENDAEIVRALRHELSHIQHKDIIFERAVKGYVKSLMRKNLNLTQNLSPEAAYDHDLLAKKGISLDDIDHAYDLLMKTWWDFHERRADMDALLDIKNNPIFKEAIKDQAQYLGYPFSYHIPSVYEDQSNIPYHVDFLSGIENDYRASSDDVPSRLFRWYNKWDYKPSVK
ncbi:MAG TPA: hypothetical protein VLG50_08925 [Candidatus Saccharimonadales bacterium]|nr:hypothetical protein [Candidatus Saccharimonadales bacterium]